MNVTFYGAVREVTGSMHLLTTDDDRILLDCGMFQGHRKESEEKNRNLPFDPRIITNVILSHAHNRPFRTHSGADEERFLRSSFLHIRYGRRV